MSYQNDSFQLNDHVNVAVATDVRVVFVRPLQINLEVSVSDGRCSCVERHADGFVGGFPRCGCGSLITPSVALR